MDNSANRETRYFARRILSGRAAEAATKHSPPGQSLDGHPEHTPKVLEECSTLLSATPVLGRTPRTYTRQILNNTLHRVGPWTRALLVLQNHSNRTPRSICFSCAGCQIRQTHWHNLAKIDPNWPDSVQVWSTSVTLGQVWGPSSAAGARKLLKTSSWYDCWSDLGVCLGRLSKDRRGGE